MKRDVVALTVTVEVYPDVWESTYGREYDAEDVVDYVREQLEASGAVAARCMNRDMQVRFRRQPKPAEQP